MTPRHSLLPAQLATLTHQHARLSRNYDIVYDLNDFFAGLVFVAGSILFFWKSTETAGTWLFVIGSLQFTLRPAIHLARDLHLRRLPEEASSRSEPATRP